MRSRAWSSVFAPAASSWSTPARSTPHVGDALGCERVKGAAEKRRRSVVGVAGQEEHDGVVAPDDGDREATAVDAHHWCNAVRALGLGTIFSDPMHLIAVRRLAVRAC